MPSPPVNGHGRHTVAAGRTVLRSSAGAGACGAESGGVQSEGLTTSTMTWEASKSSFSPG